MARIIPTKRDDPLCLTSYSGNSVQHLKLKWRTALCLCHLFLGGSIFSNQFKMNDFLNCATGLISSKQQLDL